MSLKTTKKGNMVMLLTFTGMQLGMYEVTKASKTKLAIEGKKGELIFDRATGVQTNVVEGKERYANKIVSEADAAKLPDPVKKPKKTKKVAKPVEVEEEFIDEDEFDEVVEEAEATIDYTTMTVDELKAAAKENGIKISGKKKADLVAELQALATEDTDDEDEFDDDEFEEI